MVSIESLFDFASTIAVLALLAVPYGIARDRLKNARVRQLSLGLLFGLTSVGAMLDPLVLNGVIFDMRNLPVGLAGAFVGYIGMLGAIVPAAIVRIWIGGAGVLPALAAMATAGVAGVCWRLLARRVRMGRITGPLILGAMISLHLIAYIGLPREVRLAASLEVGPVVLLANLFGTVLIGNLIAREDRRIELRRRLDAETITDPLTGVVNRRGFERETRRARAGGSGNALLLIDIDHFKRINDALGHAAGDEVLRQIGGRLRWHLREHDIVARIGGEEFAVYLSDSTREAAAMVAERLRQAVAEAPFLVRDEKLAVTISVGARWQSQPVGQWEPVFRIADDALYRAKALGRDRVVFDDAARVPPAA